MRSSRMRARSLNGQSWLFALTCALGLCFAGTVQAESSRVAVFPLSSADPAAGKLSSALTDALREQVEASDGYLLTETKASLEQLSMAQDCDAVSEECMAVIAKRLSVSAFLYGTVFTKSGHGVNVVVYLFDAGSASVQKTASATFPKMAASDAQIKDQARALADELLGRKHPVLREELLPIEGGAAAEQAPASKQVAPAASETIAPAYEASDEPTAHGGLSARRVAGYALLGTAALSAGLSVLSFVEIGRAQGDQTFDAYRRAAGQATPTPSDVCAAADAGQHYGLDNKSLSNVRDRCGLGKTYEVLQFVFIGATLASGAMSAYFLLGHDESESSRARSAAAALAVQPVVSRRSLGLSARLRF